jgi:hypothetical protein
MSLYMFFPPLPLKWRGFQKRGVVKVCQLKKRTRVKKHRCSSHLKTRFNLAEVQDITVFERVGFVRG